jgi:protein-S-isoprenylcysteine O-methyltransferase Ste14
MLLRALIAFVLLPGVFAVVVPLGLAHGFPPAHALRWMGLGPLVVGALLLLWCTREFYVAGRGTLAPWSPPRQLVVTGPYRFSRNPMYIAVIVMLLGWAELYGIAPLWYYLVGVAIAFHLRVVFGEEPWLARTHGAAWEAWRARSKRWL